MSQRIEDYALVGDTQTAALVGSDGSIDWLCVPRFDSDACFAALLGDARHGRWQLAPAAPIRRIRRRYRPDTLVLETDFETDTGAVRVVDCMPVRDAAPNLVRQVEGLEGEVPMSMLLRVRFDYGDLVPWRRELPDGLRLVAGPNALRLNSPVELAGSDDVSARFVVRAGEQYGFSLAWYRSHEPVPPALDVPRAIAQTEAWWREWSARCGYEGQWRDAVVRSLITLKALTYEPTGGVVAAPTTSLPEHPGGSRNWDYRYCWIRDATFTLYSMILAGYLDEARAWRDWLLRAVAGHGSQLQILYGVAGERRLPELELPWLPGYEGSRPVRVGNAASRQLQLDVFGELMDAMQLARRSGLPPDEPLWELQRTLIEHLEEHWTEPDHGIWELRGQPRPLTHSKVMSWVAIDRAVTAVERFGQTGPLDRWKRLRTAIHAEVCAAGFDASKNSFVQQFGSQEIDASLLRIPLVGFLPIDDPRVAGTVAAVERELLVDGLVRRYRPDRVSDGLNGEPEGIFLPCSFWLVDCYALQGRRDEACRLFERLLSLRNDVGLLSEQYDPDAARLVGNFPQAFSHVSLINSAMNLSGPVGPARDRGERQARGAQG